MLNLTINGKNITVEEGTTILQAAKDNGIYIPTLCYDDAVKVYGACGLCIVELREYRNFCVPAPQNAAREW